jgi:hypothetical protein
MLAFLEGIPHPAPISQSLPESASGGADSRDCARGYRKCVRPQLLLRKGAEARVLALLWQSLNNSSLIVTRTKVLCFFRRLERWLGRKVLLNEPRRGLRSSNEGVTTDAASLLTTGGGHQETTGDGGGMGDHL